MPTKSTQSYLDSLNPRQKEAATLGDGPALVRAGPGTGKTQALVGRVVHLLNERKIAPQKIFVATFTRAAAAEMKERIAKHAGPTAQNLFIGTFHSRAFSLLSRLGYSLNIMDARQGKALIKEAMKKVPIPESSFFEVEQNIAFWRSRTLSPERALDSVSRSKIEAVPSAKAYAVFEELRAERNLVDYEDLLLMATRDAVTQNAFEGRFEHFVVDEYQDINLRQEHFLKALMGESTNLWVVGDEDQAIYGFRGSNLRFMQNFAQTWPGAALVNLQEHYRSPQSIIDAALGLFAKEAGRAPKKLSSTRSTAALLALNGSVTPESEARLFLDNIRRLIKSGVPQSEIAILARARWLLEPVLAELRDDDTLSSVNVELSEKRGGVIVDTIHAAKGLEWRAVFLIGLEEGTLPDYRAESDAALAEERRLAYVALSRAKDYIALSYCPNRSKYPRKPSPFIQDWVEAVERKQLILSGLAQKDFVKLRTSARKASRRPMQIIKKKARKVEHKKFGKGSVIKEAGGKFHIRFTDSKIRVLKVNKSWGFV